MGLYWPPPLMLTLTLGPGTASAPAAIMPSSGRT